MVDRFVRDGVDFVLIFLVDVLTLPGLFLAVPDVLRVCTFLPLLFLSTLLEVLLLVVGLPALVVWTERSVVGCLNPLSEAFLVVLFETFRLVLDDSLFLLAVALRVALPTVFELLLLVAVALLRGVASCR